MADIATKNIANLYFWNHHTVKAALMKYIEKELGSRAVLATNMPGLNSWNINQILPTLTPNSLHTALKCNQ